MPQDTAHENSDLIFSHRKTNQAVARMAQFTVIEPQVAREESRIPKFVQEWNDFLILHPFSSYIRTDLLGWFNYGQK